MRYLVTLALLLTLNCWAQPEITPAFKPVKLQEFTSLELKILPDAGTQLIFPFKLDNPELQPGLKIRLTNANGFTVPTTKDEIENLLVGQNTITILGVVNESAPNSKYLGNLFINIGGYNLSIALKTTFNVNEHVSNIVFQLDQKERDHLVENLVKRRTKELEAKYKDKMEGIDHLAKDKSLEHVAAVTGMSSRTTRFKEEQEIYIDTARVVTYIDQALNYENTYAVLLFEIENESNKDLQFKELEIISVYEGKEKTVKGAFVCPEILRENDKMKCRFASLDTSFIKSPKLKLRMKTDIGEGTVEW